MPKRFTHDEAAQRAERFGFKLLDTYTNGTTPVTFECARGHRWKVTPENVISGRRGCPHCAGLVKYTQSSLNAKLASRGIQLVGEYGNANTPTEFQCSHGHIWVTTPGNVVAGAGCPSCATYGFKPDEPAYFYTLHLVSHSSEYVGFGITKNIDTRMGAHDRALCKQGYTWRLLDLFYFDKGHDARALESLIKEHMGCVDAGVAGFRTEAIRADDYLDLRNMMRALRVCV